jgi:hypothetical protein
LPTKRFQRPQPVPCQSNPSPRSSPSV